MSIGTRLRHLVDPIVDRSAADSAPYLGLDGIESKTGRLTDEEIPFKEADGSIAFQPGDVLFGKLRPYLAKSVHATFDGNCTGELLVMRPRTGLDGRFLFYASLSHSWLEWAELHSYGSKMPRVNWENLGEFRLPDLPVTQQRAIADFLDRETAQIDAAIDAQERLVDLLEERRAAAVDQAVTRGLDPYAELVPSGTPWIGHVPKNWSIQRIGNLGKSSIGLTYSPEDVVDDPDDGTLVLRAGNVRDGSVALEDTVYVRTPIPAALRLRRGDIVICARSGSANLVGKSAVVPPSLEGHTWGAFMTVYRSPLNDYLRWVLASSIFRRQVGLFSTSTINQLTNATFHSMRIPVPPIAAQGDIVTYLDNITIRIDAMIAKTRKLVALMRERRSALISAAVAGRLDVRSVAERVQRELEEARA